MEKVAFIETPLGFMKARIDQDSLLGFSFVTEKDTLDCKSIQEQIQYNEEENHTILHLKEWVKSYFLGQPTQMTFPLKREGTLFQLKVWTVVEEIPYGQTITYRALAEKVGVNSAQAIGQALKANPILLCVPCHRVIKSDGSLGGYVGGTERKEKLLKMEKEYVYIL